MFQTILVPVDISVPDEARRLLEKARDMSGQWNSDVHVSTVIPDVGMPIVGSYLPENFETEGRARAEGELASLMQDTGLEAKRHVLSGTVYDRVIGLAEQINADLILIAAHQPALGDYLLGSNAARLVRHSARSVLVLRHL